ncbi:MAG: sensor histidine kinase, partial [Desulfonatronovibrio sp.]|nr:ATP-binding protein [Desulfovibrionales bacterium]
DNGEGVPDDMKQSIFDKFFRMQKDVNIQGTGVGLYICGRIADMLGGKVWVENASPCGSRFCATMFSREDNNDQ